VVAVILALFIRTFAVQAFKIPTGSMEPNLMIGDHLLVNKLVYSPSFGPLENTLFGKRPIERGHVVVFKYPEDAQRDFIKRVIGPAGRDDRDPEQAGLRQRQGARRALRALHRRAAAARRSRVLPRRRVGPRRLGSSGGSRPASCSCSGDNRDNSRDSRYWGFLPIDQVKGRALLVYWSYEATREEYHRTGIVEWVWDTLSAFGRTRWKRFFHVIR
jgi:signal peptidase I